MPLSGRNAVITGASRGLGLAVALAFVREGASVLLCARDAADLEVARELVAAAAGGDQQIVALPCDVSKASAVRALGEKAMDIFSQVHILVNNAGVYGPKGTIEDVDWQEWIHAIEINLFGSVLVARAFVPHFKTHGYGKIIQLSGGGATAPLPRISAYATSKAGVVRFAETLAEELRDFGVDVNSLAPGALNTRLLDEVLAAGPESVGAAFYARAVEQSARGGVPLEKGAALAVFLASAASDGITGRLLSAVWDPWETLSDRKADLAPTDIYTLRRIVPADRGLPWT